jgi:hypothetical protein
MCSLPSLAISIRDWNHDHLELHVRFRGTRAPDRFMFIALKIAILFSQVFP